MKGLFIHLRKSKVKDNFNEKEMFYVLGYYSTMTYEDVYALKDFGPNSDQWTSSDGNSSVIDLEKYDNSDIRLIREDMEETDKDFNDCLGSSEILEDKPLLSLVFLQFSKENFEESNSIKEKLKSIIKRAIVEEGNALNATFSIYRGLGFVDAAILCRSDNYFVIGKLLRELGEQQSFVSSSHFIPCIPPKFSKKQMLVWKNCPIDRNTKLSIRVVLKPGVSEKTFIDDFYKDMKRLEIVDDEIEFYRMSGNSDIAVLSGKPVADYIKMYIEDTILSKPPAERLFLSIRTTVRMRILEGKFEGETAL